MPDHRKYLIGIILLIFFFSGQLGAQNTDTKEIYLYEYREGFFNIPFYLDTLTVGPSFQYEENNIATRCIYFDYGPYRCYFYAEPSTKYIVYLPDLSTVDPQWKENPYFEKMNLHCRIETREMKTGTKELNSAIRDFDSKYEPFLSQQAVRYYNIEYAKSQLDSFISVAFPDEKVSDRQYFNRYRLYKKASLYYHGKQADLDSLINEYLLNKPVSFNIPSYRLLFSLSLSNYFDYLERKEAFTNIYSKFSKLPLPVFQLYLQEDVLMKNDTIREMVLLKECYNAWYSESINKKRILGITDSIGKISDLQVIKRTSESLIQKLTFLKPGYPALKINALDLNGDSVIINSQNPKLVYLGFCDMNSLECMKEIEFLKYLQAKHNKYIDIVTILKPGSSEQLKTLREDENVSWQIINWDEWPELAKEYQVKAVPAFFLIDKNGKILQNPARNPSANFEYELFLILRARGEV